MKSAIFFSFYLPFCFRTAVSNNIKIFKQVHLRGKDEISDFTIFTTLTYLIITPDKFTKCMNHFLKTLLFLFLYAAIAAYGQIYVTVIDSTSENRIDDVFVTGRVKSTYTDENGMFNLSLFSINDTLSFSHLSFIQKKESVKALLTTRKIYLLLKELSTDEVKVTAEKNNENSIVFEKVELDKNKTAVFNNIGEVLKSETSLFVKEYGGYAGLRTVSSRGLGSENTVVLFNEARVNDIRTGSFDFSLLSTISADKIEYLKNSDPENTYLSTGGVIKIYSGSYLNKSMLLLGTKFNSTNMQSFFGKASIKLNKLVVGFKGERTYSPNHYNYNFEGDSYKRQNSHFSKTFAAADLAYRTRKNIFKFYTHYSYLNNGIPGYIVTNNTSSSGALNKSASVLSILNNDFRLLKNLFWNITLSYHMQHLELYDPLGQLLLVNNKQETNLYDVTLVNKLNYTKDKLKVNFGYEYNYSELSGLKINVAGTNAPEILLRNAHKLFSSVQYNLENPATMIKAIVITLAGGYEFFNEIISQRTSDHFFSFNSGLAVSFTKIPWLILRANLTNTRRQPNFNERYYSILFGNSKLQKEKFNGWDAGLEINLDNKIFKGSTKISVSYFYINTRNKILWVPSRLALQIPQNIARVNSEGAELSLHQNILNNSIQIKLLYNFTEARNKSVLSSNDLSYNKQLIYTPRHRFNINFTAVTGNFLFTLYSNYSSKRYFTNDNDNINVLPAFITFDISSTININLFNLTHSFTLGIQNLFNENYFVIQSYPMPLRSISLTYQMELL